MFTGIIDGLASCDIAEINCRDVTVSFQAHKGTVGDCVLTSEAVHMACT